MKKTGENGAESGSPRRIPNIPDGVRTTPNGDRHIPTKPDADKWALSPAQLAAVDLLTAGRNVTQAAEAVGVARQTVSEWTNRHCGFRAALNTRRQELWAVATDRLRAMVPKALDVLEREVAAGNVKAALGLLRAAGMHGLTAPAGSTTPEDVDLDEQVRAGDRRMKVLAAAAW